MRIYVVSTQHIRVLCFPFMVLGFKVDPCVLKMLTGRGECKTS